MRFFQRANVNRLLRLTTGHMLTFTGFTIGRYGFGVIVWKKAAPWAT